MKKIAWITDSTCTIPDEVCKKHHIYKVPLTVILNGEAYRDGIDISNEELFERLPKSTASTSQPSLGDFVSLYEKLKGEYDMGVSYHISSKISGTHSASVQAGEMAGFEVIGIDSLAGIDPMSAALFEAVQTYENGASIEETLDFLRKRTEDIQIYVTVGSLEQLHRSGRVKNTQALIGTLLNIKPIFRFVNGEVTPVDKARSQKKALVNILEQFKADVNSTGVSHVSIFHADALDVAETFKGQVLEVVSSVEVTIRPISPVVGVLAGKGTIGLTWLKNS